MCGIAGFTPCFDPTEAPAILAAMMAPMRHRGPDGQGTHIDGGAAFAHLRLSIVDIGGGAQPWVDAETGDLLVFNGEIYGFRRAARDLEERGIALRSTSDTEVLFRTIQAFGIAGALERLDGMFAFAYREGRTKRVHLARDRFGEKPLFYAIAGQQLIFASEIKALRRHPALRATGLDPEAVARYLTFEFVPGEESGFEGIRRLLPGHFLSFENGHAATQCYWRPNPVGQGPSAASEAERLERLDGLLTESVRDRLVADVPVGVFLSGGIDSSLVTALAARQMRDITAYTVEMPDESHDETPFARAVAARYGLRHEVVSFGTDDVVQAFSELQGRIDEPMADASILPTYLLCKAARRSMTVALGGDGADELFAGYPNFKARRFARFLSHVPRAAGKAFRSLVDRLPPSEGYLNLPFKLRQLSHGCGQPPDLQSPLWMAAFAPSEVSVLLVGKSLRAPAETLFTEAVGHLHGRYAGLDPMARLLHLFTVSYMCDEVLVKVDRAAMYNSLEVRSPFLCRTLAEYVFTLPPSDKINGLTTKYLLKKLAIRYLDDSLVNRPKHGFAPPVAALLRGALRRPVEDVLLDSGNPVAGWFSRPLIERLWREHQERRRDHRKKLWALFVLFQTAANSRG